MENCKKMEIIIIDREYIYLLVAVCKVKKKKFFFLTRKNIIMYMHIKNGCE